MTPFSKERILMIKGNIIAVLKRIGSFLLMLFISHFFMLLYLDKTEECLFALAPSVSYVESYDIIFAWQMAGSLLLYAVSNKRGIVQMMLNALLPVGAIVISALLKCYTWLLIPTPFAIVAAFFLSRMYCDRFDKDPEQAPTFECLRYSLILLIVPLTITANYFDIPVYAWKGTSNHMDIRIEDLEVKHKETCVNLEERKWQELSVQEKLDLLQVIGDYEAKIVLGLESSPTIQVGLTGDEEISGTYSYIYHTVTINAAYLESAKTEDVLKTLFHELRHAYQYEVSKVLGDVEVEDKYQNLLVLREARAWGSEFSEYCDAEESLVRYLPQEVEKDARAWGVTRFYEYKSYVYPQR